MKDKLSDLDERVTDVNGLCTSLIEQVDNLCHMDIPDLQAQIDASGRIRNRGKRTF